MKKRDQQRISVSASGVLPTVVNTGITIPVFKVPFDSSLAIRRLNFDVGAINETQLASSYVLTLGNLAYLRSGTRIQWGNPKNPTITGAALPGVETWGDEEGPELTAGEVFEVRYFTIFIGTIGGSPITITLDGILEKVVKG